MRKRECRDAGNAVSLIYGPCGNCDGHIKNDITNHESDTEAGGISMSAGVLSRVVTTLKFYITEHRITYILYLLPLTFFQRQHDNCNKNM
jgi:hypothetical protein